MKKNPNADPVLADARNKILLSRNPYDGFRWVAADDPENLGYLMPSIMRFIDACYDMNLNPLKHLREYFPRFEWIYCKPETDSELVRILLFADYVWPNAEDCDWSTGMIVARERGNQQFRRICYGGTADAHFCLKDLVKSKVGCRFFVNKGKKVEESRFGYIVE